MSPLPCCAQCPHFFSAPRPPWLPRVVLERRGSRWSGTDAQFTPDRQAVIVWGLSRRHQAAGVGGWGSQDHACTPRPARSARRSDRRVSELWDGARAGGSGPVPHLGLGPEFRESPEPLPGRLCRRIAPGTLRILGLVVPLWLLRTLQSWRFVQEPGLLPWFRLRRSAKSCGTSKTGRSSRIFQAPIGTQGLLLNELIFILLVCVM